MTEKLAEREIIPQIQYVQALVESLQEEIRRMNILRNQLSLTLLGLKEVKTNRETLSSIGSGVYAFTKPLHEDKFLINVGANVYVTKSKEKTLEYLSKQLNEVNKLIQKYQSQLLNYISLLDQLNAKLSRLSQKQT